MRRMDVAQAGAAAPSMHVLSTWATASSSSGGTSTYAQRVMNAYEIYRKYYFPPQPSAMA